MFKGDTIMNFYMFLKLRSAVKNEVINIGTSDEHIDYMIDKNWLEPDIYQSTRFNDDPIPLLLGTAKVTKKGRNQYYKVRNKWIIPPISTICVTIIVTLIKSLF